MAPLFTTHPTGNWVHCDKGHKTWGLPMNKISYMCLPAPPRGCCAGPAGQGSILEEKRQYLVGESPTKSLSAQCMGGPLSGLIEIKALNLFSGGEKKRFICHSGVQKCFRAVKILCMTL